MFCLLTKPPKNFLHWFPDRDYEYVIVTTCKQMSLACSSTHKKPVCDKCDAGTNCTKCCTCQPRTRGRPKKVSAVQETPQAQRLNPKRLATCTLHSAAEPDSDLDTARNEESSNDASSQERICQVLKLMGCDEYESCVRTLPSIEIRRHAECASDKEIDHASMTRLQNVFWKGIKAWAHVLLPNLRLNEGSKKVFNLRSLATPAHESTHIDTADTHVNTQVVTTIRDMLYGEKLLTSYNSRMLLVTLVDVPISYVASLLSLSKHYAARLMFQAKIDKAYLDHGIKIQQFCKTHSRVPKDVIECAVEFIYCEENISRLAWEAKKRAPNKSQKWRKLENVFAMRSLVLKKDIATMYDEYVSKQNDALPGKAHISKSLFYTIVKHITGGGKQQEARAGVDYIKVNFHIDNFIIVDKVIDTLAPPSDIDQTLRNELCGLRKDVYTFLSYGYALHAREGVKSSEIHDNMEHQSQEHEALQFKAYQELEELVSQPEDLDQPAIQEAIVTMVRSQLNCCAQANGSVVDQSNSATTHSPVFALDLVPNRKPNKNPKAGGRLECSACRSPFLFFDRLRHVAVTKLDVNPTRLPEIADLLLAIHQCERRSYRYMAHVMQAAQQAYKMKLAIAEMDSNTAYIVYDFKQKFLAKGFREGGDSYYGKKGMLWWGAGVFIKSATAQEDVTSSPPASTDKNYVEIDFSSEETRLMNQLEAVQNIEQDANVDEGDGCALSEDEAANCEEDEHEWSEGHECMWEEESEQKLDEFIQLEGDRHQMEDEEGIQFDWDEGQRYEWGERSEHEVISEQGLGGEGSKDLVRGKGSEDEVGGKRNEDEVRDEQQLGSEQGSQHDMGADVEQENDQQILHFFDCIVQGEQKCDSNIVLSCFEAALHALRCQFPHVKKLIIQSDNARNLAGKQTKLLLPHVCSAAGFKLVAYYHNEAQSGKDVCDTHFSHQQTHLEAYLKHGDGGQKISTPKQLAVALMEKSITNTTVLLIKPNFTAPYRSATCPSINGITQFYAAKYTTTVLNQQTVLFYNCLGQSIPSLCVNVPSCHAFSLITPMGEYGINFTGVTVLLISDSDDASTKVRVVKNRYAKRATCSSNKELQRMEERQEYEETMRQIRAVYPQCSQCFYHYKSQKLLDKHVCGGEQQCQDALSTAMRHADKLLAQMNFTISGAINKASHIGASDAVTFATFEPNFYSGWAYVKRNMQPELTTRVKTIINECWKAGESKEQGTAKISADGVFSRLEEMEKQKAIRLSELPLSGKIRTVYQTIGQMRQESISTGGCNRVSSQSSGLHGTKQKKARVSFEELDIAKDLSLWKKPELEAYLCHYGMKKSGNKPELIKRIQEHKITV